MAAVNIYNPVSEDVTQPARHAVAITPSDSVDLAYNTRGIYVGGAGNMVAIMAGGETVTFTGLLAGLLYPLSISRVLATNTTATAIVGVY